jgi:hypothetical protein
MANQTRSSAEPIYGGSIASGDVDILTMSGFNGSTPGGGLLSLVVENTHASTVLWVHTGASAPTGSGSGSIAIAAGKNARIPVRTKANGTATLRLAPATAAAVTYTVIGSKQPV